MRNDYELGLQLKRHARAVREHMPDGVSDIVADDLTLAGDRLISSYLEREKRT